MNIQNVAGLRRTVEMGIAKVEAMLPEANKATRSPCPPLAAFGSTIAASSIASIHPTNISSRPRRSQTLSGYLPWVYDRIGHRRTPQGCTGKDRGTRTERSVKGADTRLPFKRRRLSASAT